MTRQSSPFVKIVGYGVFEKATIPQDSPLIYLTVRLDGGWIVLSVKREDCPTMHINDTVLFSCSHPHFAEDTVVWDANFVSVIQSGVGAKKF